MTSEDSRVCPFCAETIKAAAIVCRYCHRDLPAIERASKTTTLGTPLTYEDARSHMSEKMWNALVFAGRPSLYLNDEGKVIPEFQPGQKDMVIAFSLGEEYARIWVAAGKPDIKKFAEGLEKQADQMSPAAQQGDTVIRVLDEDEIKQRATKDQYRVWKKIGKPAIVLRNESELMYRSQLEFQDKYGSVMPSDIFDLWVWAGQPTIEFWDIQQSASLRQQQMAQVAQMQMQQLAQNKMSFMNAVSDGLGQVGAALANSSRQSSFPSGQSSCGVCGQPIAMMARICPYCHTKRM